MAKVLTMASNITCGHNGKVATASEAPLTVMKQPVLTTGTVEMQAIAGCTIVPSADASGTPVDVTCVSVSPGVAPSPPAPGAITKGKSQALLIQGEKVLLDSLGGATNGLQGKKPTLDLKADALQEVLTAE